MNGPSQTTWKELKPLKGGVSDLVAHDGSFYLLTYHRSPRGTVFQLLRSYDGAVWTSESSPLDEPTGAVPHWPSSTLLSSGAALVFWMNSESWKPDELRAKTTVGWSEPKPVKRSRNGLDSLAIGPRELFAMNSKGRDYKLYRSPDLGSTWVQVDSDDAFHPPEGFREQNTSGVGVSAEQYFVVDGKNRLHVFRADLAYADEEGNSWPKILHSRSEDEGRSFVRQLLSVPHISTVGHGPTLTVGTNPSDPDFLALVSVGAIKPGEGVYYTTSHDGGQTWKEPVNVNPSPEMRCTRPAIGVDGSLIAIAWMESQGLENLVKVAVSKDAGKSWSAGEVVGEAKNHGLAVAVLGQAVVVTSHDGDQSAVFRGALAVGGGR